MRDKKLSNFIANAVAFALGIASVVMLFMKQPQETIIPLLAIGLLCLGFANLTNSKKENK